MLQQTTVAAVVPYFERFIARFPSIADLAAASESDVLHAWSGLGYYRRARFLHTAAKMIVERHGGTFPSDPSDAAELPGIGRYTLGAILSQAFDARWPVVEANTLRVISRLFGSRFDPRSSAGQKWLWNAAELLLPKANCGDFNQAMMELGALVCRIEAPQCGECPLKNACRAKRDGTHTAIPFRPSAKPIVEQHEVGLVLRKAGKYLLVRREEDSRRWAGFWQFPAALTEQGVIDSSLHALAGSLGMTVEIGEVVYTDRYVVTRHRIELTLYEARIVSDKLPRGSSAVVAWKSAIDAESLPMGTPQRKAISKIAAAGGKKLSRSLRA